jgi:hypothetical protein
VQDFVLMNEVQGHRALQEPIEDYLLWEELFSLFLSLDVEGKITL